MSDALARSRTEVEVCHVIVRACFRCGHGRQLGEPCAGCGLTDPPVMHDLGRQSYWHKNPLRRLWWRLVARHIAASRAKAAARYLAPGPESESVR